MCEAFEKTLVSHCAPTLAEHKCGSLFNLHGVSHAACADCLMEANTLLQPKGVRVRLLKECKDCCLIYVYRPTQLQAKRKDTAVRAFLADSGCAGTSPDLARCLCGDVIHTMTITHHSCHNEFATAA